MVPPLICVCRLVTLLLVENNWLPFTASVLLTDRVPADTPISTRVPAVPVKFTSVPSVAAPTVMGWPAPDCCTRPIVPPLICVCRLVTLLLVENNWLPFTASVLPADRVPA